MVYPVIKHSVCFAVSLKSNILSITRPSYIVWWKYEHTHVIEVRNFKDELNKWLNTVLERTDKLHYF